uniref:Uncharacterized protein LOC111116703 isoform X1 n=1 Tax=Crassostrea virginica TaxID=6565 RepID=A0A8B8C6Q2_CRAVI|nr:uncharacterized protein LOC111116703 isoform X1 [Crassostrea virginica]XP_022311398.1 uncharacterized protein LOC111116703 isoform X1 [Crassostrea virginica]
MRTSTEAQKQYSNLKQRAKGKLSELKRPKTGGGPKPPSPSPVEQCILDNLEGRPSLEGIVGGIDTAGPYHEDQPSCSVQEKNSSNQVKVGKPSSTKRPRIQDLEMKNLQLENEKLQEEVSKIKMEKDLLKIPGKEPNGPRCVIKKLSIPSNVSLLEKIPVFILLLFVENTAMLKNIIKC